MIKKLLSKIHTPQWYVYNKLYNSWKKMNRQQYDRWGTAGDIEGELNWLRKRDECR